MKIEGDGGVFSHFLVEGITAATIAYSLMNPKSGFTGSDDGGVQRRDPYRCIIFWSCCWLEGLSGGPICI
jgi:hypothetical protein